MTTIVTAMYGAFDTLREQTAQDMLVDWVCVVDSHSVPVPEPWRRVVALSNETPCLAAKRAKFEPWRFIDDEDVIWVDANMQVTAPGFAREALACRQDGMATWQHPRRDCIYTEAKACTGIESQGGKYDGQPIAEQVQYYRQQGHPKHWGLYACGTIAWDYTNPNALEIGARWTSQVERWTLQDQLSLPVVCRDLGLRPGVFPYPQVTRRSMANPWLTIHPHLSR